MAHRGRITHARLMCGAAMLALLSTGSVAVAQENAKFNIAPQPLASALNEFAVQSPWPILYTSQMTGGKTTAGVNGETDPELALNTLLQGTGLGYRREGNTFLIVSASDPQSGSAAGAGADSGTVQALIVTAQKREENIQDVPIAMSAFTQEDLTRSQVTGGPDLMTQVPNFTFTKTNFTGYSIQIRGIGTQAISATTDAAVAVAENNTPFIRNRFFEQEFYDLQRVEVLRGPQGTLYGRNATAGVVNIITAKPSFHYEAKLSADVGNYNSTRLEGMINLPLADDHVALRLAGAWTKRDGYATNQQTGNPIDGRDLWSTRVSLRVEPTSAFRANLIWEHFQEDDDRLRSGKQLCRTDNRADIAGVPIVEIGGQVPGQLDSVLGLYSQGCLAASLYSPDSYQVPNGYALPYYTRLFPLGLPIVQGHNPYLSATQSSDLRVIESSWDPQYRAKNDVGELQISVDVGRALTLTSETAYSSDTIWSIEDFNRFTTRPGAFTQDLPWNADKRDGLLVNGVYCDPQLGCSDRLLAVDLSTARSRHFSQEFRLSSNFDGPFNFSLGANFLRYDTTDKYYVFINTLTLLSAVNTNGAAGLVLNLPPWQLGVSDNHGCMVRGLTDGDLNHIYNVDNCKYIEPNPIGALNDLGHNYFLSKNPYKLISYAVFGETYYNITPDLKLTAGLRWTVDKKEAPRIPSELLIAYSVGYPVAEVIHQEWREPTGRLALDWKPDLSFTDETLVYGSYAHGYKAGGANPPGIVITGYCTTCNSSGQDFGEVLRQQSLTHPRTFKPEFVNAFEIGSKNTLLDGRLTLNGSAFYYDYTGYQISEIVDRAAINHNYDARVWGLELEADWRPLENLRLGFKGGYEKTKVAKGMYAIDLMDRTGGDPNWVVVKAFPTVPSNCILPTWLVTYPTADFSTGVVQPRVNSPTDGIPGACVEAYQLNHDPVTGLPYVPNPTNFYYDTPGQWPNYPGWDPATAPNHGEGVAKSLAGKELPNAPHFTATITTDYTLPLHNDWLMTLHGDFYYQSEAWARIFNTPGYDKLKAFTNVNLAAIFTNEDAGWKVMAYVKNVFDKTNITGAFLNSDDTGLTTNVFLNEPRLYGIRVTKEWTGGSIWGGGAHEGPYPFQVELEGDLLRHDAPYETIRPDFFDQFSAFLNPAQAQHRPLDWGQGGSIKLTYRPTSSPWSISSGFRWGSTGTVDQLRKKTKQEQGSCLIGPPLTYLPYPFWQHFCEPGRYFQLGLDTVAYPTDYTNARLETREEHEAVDFAVGKEVGLGGFMDRSQISGGISYANLKSPLEMSVQGIPHWEMPSNWAGFKYSQHDRFDAHIDASRSFRGAGPTVSWEASKKVLQFDGGGAVDLSLTAAGGVLFGKQNTQVSGQMTDEYFNVVYAEITDQYPSPTTTTTTPVNIHRSKSATVPLLDLSLGLSYEAQRVKVETGYRWERYFNAIDGGYQEHKSYDRTIDGPYFKIAVGFGG